MLALPAAKTYMDSFEVFNYNMVLSKQKSEYRKGDAIVDEDGFTRVVSRQFMKGIKGQMMTGVWMRPHVSQPPPTCRCLPPAMYPLGHVGRILAMSHVH